MAKPRAALLAALNEIRGQAILAPDCLRFDILSVGAAQGGREFVVAHAWATPAAADRVAKAEYLKKHDGTIAGLVSANSTDKFQRL